MTKPFQFSLGRTLFGLSCFSVAAWSLSIFFRYIYHLGAWVWLLVILFCFSIGTGVGAFADDELRSSVAWTAVFIALLTIILLGAALMPAVRS